MTYDIKIGAKKFLRAAVFAAVLGVVNHFTHAENITAIIGSGPQQEALTVAIGGAMKWLGNYLKTAFGLDFGGAL